MKTGSVAIMIYGDVHSNRNALTEEKYKDLASAFLSAGFDVQSVMYNDESSEELYTKLLNFEAVLVWVNPIEEGKDRRKLDSLLLALAHQGCLVSTHPEVILKMGTKEVLFQTKDMGWGSPTTMYSRYEDFVEGFAGSLQQWGVTILKQHRGNGGNGVFKVSTTSSLDEVRVIHAKYGDEPRQLGWDEFYQAFKPYFADGGMLIEQAWNEHLANGMVRCYLCGNKVAGFGYQEINALYESTANGLSIRVPPSKRYYFTENCGLFSDLKAVMETSWVPQLQERQSIPDELIPVIWDADFFINDINSPTALGKYTLCEINVSCVSPFPPSAIRLIVDEVQKRIGKKKITSR